MDSHEEDFEDFLRERFCISERHKGDISNLLEYSSEIDKVVKLIIAAIKEKDFNKGAISFVFSDAIMGDQ